jgi:hypothetical protein
MNNQFYNTINETGDELKTSRAKAWGQDEKVLGLFIEYPDAKFTPFEVLEFLALKNTPITSIRRSMNSLTRDGKLEKTGEQKMGNYGKRNYCWKLIK